MKEKIEPEFSWKYNDQKYWPYNGMVNDLYRGLQTDCNYLVGLGLVCYSEAIGRWIRKEVDHISPYRSDGMECWVRFVKDYMMLQFSDFPYIYRQVRHGLAHAYFMKTRGGVYNPGVPTAIVVELNGDLSFNVQAYFDAFVVGITKWLDSRNAGETKT